MISLILNKLSIVIASILFLLFSLQSKANNIITNDVNASPNSNLEMSISVLNTSLEKFFKDDMKVMHRFYNPFTEKRSDEKASVWMYTSAIESVNSVLKTLKHAKHKDIQSTTKYETLLEKLYDNADYYLGTFELISFTQTNTWSVYAVDRVNEKGKARVTGIYNVYDDQMWLIRELLESYHLTSNEKYLQKAEYLTEYVLDGWDATRDASGNEHGGIPWGPGYVTKHACSNGPMVSPLVWLHEIYKNKKDKISYSYIDAKDKKSRKTKMIAKRDYYLDFANKIYAWQKKNLLNSDGVYTDMMGDCDPNCNIQYEEIAGVKYRANTPLLKAIGRAYAYNSATMLSGAVDLFRVTKKKSYFDDAKSLAKASFDFFARRDAQLPSYYSFPFDGFNNWFNTVLLRSYVDFLPLDKSAESYIDAFKQNLDYANKHYVKDGLLPTDLLGGWEAEQSKNNLEGMFMFSYASQYALFAQSQNMKH